MRSARPSAIADLPTPGSPIKRGLFFFRLLNICETRSISFSLPTTGSSLSCLAIAVISLPKLSKTGVLDLFTFTLSEVGTKGFSLPALHHLLSHQEKISRGIEVYYRIVVSHSLNCSFTIS